MAFIELPQIMPSARARNGSYLISTAALGPTTDVYMVSAYTDDISISAVCSTAAVVDIEVTASPLADVQGTSGIAAVWAPLAALTGVTNTAKFAGLNNPISAIRANVKTNLAGNLTLAIKTDATSQ
jgi:hypothetical protein